MNGRIANLHTVFVLDGGLCVRCNGCGKRNVLTAQQVGAHMGNMTQVRDLRLVCSACGSRDIDRCVAPSRDAAARFMDGVDIQSAVAV